MANSLNYSCQDKTLLAAPSIQCSHQLNPPHRGPSSPLLGLAWVVHWAVLGPGLPKMANSRQNGPGARRAERQGKSRSLSQEQPSQEAGETTEACHLANLESHR